MLPLSIRVIKLMLNRKTKIDYGKFFSEVDDIYNEVLKRSVDAIKNTDMKTLLLGLLDDEIEAAFSSWIFYISVSILRCHKFVAHLDIGELGYFITLRQYANVLRDRHILSEKGWRMVCARISGCQRAMFKVRMGGKK